MSTTICPEEIRTANRFEMLEDIWATPEWRSNSDVYIAEHPVCHYCGKPSKLVHHTSKDDYPNGRMDLAGIKRYMDFTRSKVVPCCFRCHAEYRKGRVICPKCKKHYIALDQLCCEYCLPPAERLKRRADRREARRSQSEWKKIKNRINSKNSKAIYQAQKLARQTREAGHAVRK